MAQYQSSLTGPEIDAALTDMARHDSEAWAVGTRDGEAVSSLDITYHNNAEYYATKADAAAARAESAVPAGTAGAVFFDQAQTLTDAQKTQAQTNIGAYGVPARNILDNGWFTINQRERTSASASGSYIVDRWKVIQNLSATVNADGSITLQPTASGNTYFVQDFPSGTFKVGDRITISLLVNGVVHSRNLSFRDSVGYSALVPSISNVSVCPYNTGTVDRISIRLNGGTSQTLTITAIKAEWTLVSTLALDGPPDYSEELRRCQRYLYAISSRSALAHIGMGFRWNNTGSYLVNIPLPVEMRATPTVTLMNDNISDLMAIYQSSTGTSATSLNVYNLTGKNDIVIRPVFPSQTAEVIQVYVANSNKLLIRAET